MEPNTLNPHVTYVTPVEDGSKLSLHQAFYQRNSRRLKQEARERWHRNQRKYETLPKSEQEVIKERRRQSSAAYREKHRDELRIKERLRRQRRKATMEHLDMS